MNRRELSEVVAEAAACTERAAARTETARAEIEALGARAEASRVGIEAARKRQEEALLRQGEILARHEAARAEANARWDEERRESMRRAEQGRQRTEAILAELRDQRDERRALIEALLEMIDRLPPPPSLRSA